jgi:hypothetical protein
MNSPISALLSGLERAEFAASLMDVATRERIYKCLLDAAALGHEWERGRIFAESRARVDGRQRALFDLKGS